MKVSTWPGEAQNVAAELTWLPLSPVVAVNAAEVVDCVSATVSTAATPRAAGGRVEPASAASRGLRPPREAERRQTWPAARSYHGRLKRKPRVFLGVRGVPGGPARRVAGVRGGEVGQGAAEGVPAGVKPRSCWTARSRAAPW